MSCTETYAALLRFADWIWQASLSALSSRGELIPGATKLTNIARQGFSGHHYVFMAFCSVAASFLVNPLFAFATKPRGTLSPAQLAVAWKISFEQSCVAYARVRNSLTEPNDNGCRDADSTEECVGAAVVAH